jgi:hypothetical protein
MNNIIPLYDYNNRYPYLNSFNSYPVIEESPESIIAKTDYRSALELLEQRSKQNHYQRLAEIGQNIVNSYVNNLRPEDTKGIRKIIVEPEVVTQRNWFGRPTAKGMVITFERDD